MDIAVIKTHSSTLIKPITHLINLSIRVGKFPQTWKTAVITPILKAGAPDKVSNYRPISILPVLSKILEKIVAEQLVDHLENNLLIYPKQFAFRPGYSTEMANCYLSENIKSSLDKGNVVGAVFIDLKQAFDTVNHEVLLNKLSTFYFSKQAIAWFTSYLESREQCVKINAEYSTTRQSTMGIPQGSILGPLLFSLYINDLPSCCKKAECQMYADDTIIYMSAKTPCVAADILTSEMEGVSLWLKNNHLTLNLKKTVSMCFSMRRKAKEKLIIRINQEEIEEVNDFKFLGVILDPGLKFDKHVKKLCKTVKTNLNCFRMIRHYIPLKAAQLFMHAMIFSHLSYCVTVWSQASQSTVKPIISLYKQALKIMDQKQMKWHHCIILKKYNLLSYDSFIKLSFIKLIFKCVNNLAPAVLCQYVTKTNTNGITTRGSANGNCRVAQRKTTFGQSSFSVKGIHFWNVLPTEIKTLTNLKPFNEKVRHWLKLNQICDH
uniref:Reverse transcriptase domain-containing protein n=1 Tax=Cyprinus carpio TaxID=7962 RepID=A0A8C1L0A4_CYPCA